jgi:hypothetical protein
MNCNENEKFSRQALFSQSTSSLKMLAWQMLGQKLDTMTILIKALLLITLLITLINSTLKHLKGA